MKRRTRLLALLLLVLMLPGIAGCSGPGKKEAVEAFEQESEKLSFQMRKLQEAIEVEDVLAAFIGSNSSHLSSVIPGTRILITSVSPALNPGPELM